MAVIYGCAIMIKYSIKKTLMYVIRNDMRVLWKVIYL